MQNNSLYQDIFFVVYNVKSQNTILVRIKGIVHTAAMLQIPKISPGMEKWGNI